MTLLLKRAQRACEGAARGIRAPQATEPGSGAEPRLVREGSPDACDGCEGLDRAWRLKVIAGTRRSD